MSTVDSYLEKFPEAHAARLSELRALIREELPEAQEEIKWSSPAYSTETILVTFAGFKKHFNVYFTPSTMQACAELLSEYKAGKSALSLDYDKPLPRALLTKLLAFRRAEYERDDIGWI